MSALDALSDRDLVVAGLCALHEKAQPASATLLAVMRLVILDARNLGAVAGEVVISAAVLACATGQTLHPDERARIVAAFAKLGVDSADIIVAAAELQEAS